MPIYEYEPDGWECHLCNGRVEAMQGINEEPLKHCPTCGMDVRKVISRVSFSLNGRVSADKAAQKGFSTFRKLESGTYEKVAGEGPDILQSPDD
jgi:putative FmdB family regulatory protein